MPVIGKIDEFNVDTAVWTEYRERVELFLTVNDVPDGKKMAVFLTCCGAVTYYLLRSLLVPEKPAAANLAAIFEALNNHFAPKGSEVVASFKFFSRHRRDGEVVSEYFVSLKRLANDCKFGSVRVRMLPDQIVSGIDDVPKQTRLLEMAELNLESAMSMVQAIEAARKNSCTLSAHPTLQSESAQLTDGTVMGATNVVQPGHREHGCFRCGGTHQAHQCQHVNSVCYKCGWQWHLDGS
ncbi:uncharacterized protein [Dermacentor andersoni]|uniref:uncharacterized protein n=1 Tax=Dermacentor andersoni TaxID=34620 RepID=UPI003B3B2855